MNVWKDGENLACRHLEGRGFTILERNFRIKAGEIDIIARRDDLLVFCEVKARESDEYGRPFEAVTPYKQGRIRRVAEAYLAIKNPDFEDARFDVISIENGGITHIENAFW